MDERKKNGGARQGAGRLLGGRNRSTLEKQMVRKALEQRIMQKANRLLRAMMSSAEGEYYLFKEEEQIIEDKDGNTKTKKAYVVVKDPVEIENFLNEHADGSELGDLAGEVDGTYYYIRTTPADWRAIDSLFDRVFGKSTQVIDVEGITVNEYEQLNDEQLDRQIRELKAAIATIGNNTEASREDSTSGGTGEIKLIGTDDTI